ncbi:alpha/beta hydrolase family protein [Nonomuraea aurantiaca]|uniref:alpha/beta hydrolase family protein n=1 Tax=Nonomuraea aurantiaca TaxID=2878562 RepID=UPI001CD936FA|nr:alpha/beta fold hydrolase [Nonomuraea aurantiaca]MCA2230237.1 alpha/beta fold hydrolase [Nonomuraea aurantiaca]
MATQPALWPTLVSLRSRLTFRYSATGRTAAALFTDGHGTLLCEFWRLHGASPDCHQLGRFELRASNADVATMPTDAVPFDDGTVLFVSPTGLVVLRPDGQRQESGPLPFRPEVVAPAPDGTHRALFIGREGARDGDCLVWWWHGLEEQAHHIGTLPPLLLRGGGWLDRQSTRYVVNRIAGSRTRPAIYDLRRDELNDLPIGTGSEGDLAWLTAPLAGEVLFTSEFTGEHRVGLLRPGHDARMLTAPERLAGSVTPMAMRPQGGAVALHLQDGLRDRVSVLDTNTDTLLPLTTPPDHAFGAMGWGERLWSFAVGCGFPGRLIGPEANGWVEVHDGTDAGRYSGWAPSSLEMFPGAESEIEAIVCGHQDWRSAPLLVVALHGGPASRWSLKFSQLFQLFTDEGVTVIAPNPRGSTGYGDKFHEFIVGAWGGPDLADVLALVAHIYKQRGGAPLAVYGSSYGAFLALLAASAQPEFFSRVLAVAPFMSVASLYQEADAEVRAMIDRLDGRREITDERGSRDVLNWIENSSARLLFFHGSEDRTIPVTQSRRLAERLARLGRKPNADYKYVEVGGAGHAPLDGSAELHHAAARFVANGDLPAADR